MPGSAIAACRKNSRILNMLNLLIPLVLLELMALMAAVPNMIEHARKNCRDLHMYDLRNLAGDKFADAADFIERYYSHDRVVLLKMAQGLLWGLLFSAILFGGSGYYVQNSVVPDVKHFFGTICPPGCQLGSMDGVFNRFSDVCYRCAFGIVIFVLVSLGTLSYFFNLPQNLRNIIYPKK